MSIKVKYDVIMGEEVVTMERVKDMFKKNKGVYTRTDIETIREDEEYGKYTVKDLGYKVRLKFYGEVEEVGTGYEVKEEGLRVEAEVYIPVKYAKGWDEATDLAVKKVREKITGEEIGLVLDNKIVEFVKGVLVRELELLDLIRKRERLEEEVEVADRRIKYFNKNKYEEGRKNLVKRDLERCEEEIENKEIEIESIQNNLGRSIYKEYKKIIKK